MRKQSLWLIRFLFLFLAINFNPLIVFEAYALIPTYYDNCDIPHTSSGELCFNISGGCTDAQKLSNKGVCPPSSLPHYASCSYTYTGVTYPNHTTGLCGVILVQNIDSGSPDLSSFYSSLQNIINTAQSVTYFKEFRIDIGYSIFNVVDFKTQSDTNFNGFLGAEVYAICDFGNGKPTTQTLLYQDRGGSNRQAFFFDRCKQLAAGTDTESASMRANGQSTPADQAIDNTVINDINLADTVTDAKALADNSPSCNGQTVACHQCLDTATTISAVKSCVCQYAMSNTYGTPTYPGCSLPVTGGAKAAAEAAKNDPTAKADAAAAAAAAKSQQDALDAYNACADNDASCKDAALAKLKDAMGKASDAKAKATASANAAAGIGGSGSSSSTGPNSQACKDSKDPTKQGNSSSSTGAGFNGCNSYELAVDHCYRTDDGSIWSGTLAAYPDAACVDKVDPKPPPGRKVGAIVFFNNGVFNYDHSYPYNCGADEPTPPRDPKTGKPTTPTKPTDPCAGGTGTGSGTGNGTGNGATSSDIKGLQDSLNSNGDKNAKSIVDALNKTGTAPTVTKQGLYTSKSSGQTFGTIWDSKKSSFDNSTFVQGLKKMTFTDPGGSCPTFGQLGAISLAGHNVFEGGDMSVYICPILLFFRAAFLFLAVMVARQILWG